MLEIFQDVDKYFLHPTFNITMPEVVKESRKEAVDSYLADEHTGEKLMNYAPSWFWKSKSNTHKMNQASSSLKKSVYYFENPMHGRRLFSVDSVIKLVRIAVSLS